MKVIRNLLFLGLFYAVLCAVFYRFGGREPAPPGRFISVLHQGAVMELPLEEYLVGVVAAEMPASFHAEALKAQAVAARTYVLHSRRHEEANVCTSSGCCLAWMDEEGMKARWGLSFGRYRRKITRAVAATEGEVLTYEGELISAVFHASSGGATESSGNVWTELPYLVSVSTPETAETVPGLVSTVTLSPEDLGDALGLATDLPPEEWVQAVRYNDAGRVKGVLIAGKAFTGTYLRGALGLRSTDFDVVWDGESFLFTVTGHGHGVGMSQYGAGLLAADGRTYDAILAHYYPGTEPVQLP